MFYISNILNVYGKSKLSNKEVPLLGGIIILIFYHLTYYFFGIHLIQYDISINIILTLFFVLGYLDDKYSLSASIRLISQFILCLSFLYMNNFFLISNLNLFSISIEINLFLSYLLTIISFMVLLNCLNYFDGLNGLVIFFTALFVLLFFYFIQYTNILFIIIIFLPISFVFYLNITDKIFLGDSGVYIISFILSLMLIFMHNHVDSELNGKSIMPILIFFIPFLDFLRVSISRLINKRSLLHKDSNHLHDLLFKKIGNKATFLFLIVFQTFIIINVALFNRYSFQLIIIFLLIYFTSFYIIKKKL